MNRLERLKKEIDRLAVYLMKSHGDRIGEDGRNEGAVDVAIRLLEEKQ